MTYSSDVLTDSPLGYWRLEETSGSTVTDSSGSSRDGTYFNTPTLNQAGLLGEGGACVDFNGSDEYAKVTDAAWMDVSAFTVHCMVRPDVVSSYNPVVTRDGASGSRGWNIYILNGNLHCFDANLGGSVATGSVSLSTATTYHIAMVSTGTQVRLYVNGTLDVQVTASLGNTLANDLMFAGSQAGGAGAPSFYFNGKIDEVVYVGTDLSGSRIADLSTAAFAAPANTLTHTANVPGVTSSMSLTVINNLTHNANVPGVTSSFTLLNTVGVTHAANVPGVTSSFVVEVTEAVRTVVHNANVPGVTSSFALDVVNHLTHVANVPGVTSSATLLTSLALTHTANVPGVTSNFTLGVGLLAITHDANVPGVSSTFSITVELGYTESDDENAAGGLILDGNGTWTWNADVAPLPGGFYPRAHGSYDVAQAFGEVVDPGAHVTLEPTYAREPRQRVRVVLGGQDVSFYGGYEVVVADYQLVQPFLYSTATLVFPQILGIFGMHNLPSFLAKETRASLETVNDETGEVTGVVYKGRVAAWNPQGRDLRVELLGEVRGPASTRYKPPPLIPWRRDMGHLTARMLRNLGVDARPRLGAETGYILGEPGGGWLLEHLEDMHAQAWTLDGDQWSTMPDEDGIYRTALKDRATVDMSAYPDDTRVVVDLRSDITEEHNRIFGRGTTKDGMVVNNGVYPGMIEVKDVPAFPGTMNSGDSGDNVTELIHRLRQVRYMNANEAAGGYDDDVVDAVKELQEDAGLTQTGIVNLATWRALWDLDVTGASPRGAQIVPMAQRDYTREWFHSGGGAFTGLNPDFDANRQWVDLPVEYGAKQRRNQMVRRSKALLAGVEEQWVGTIRITTGAVVAGDHTPGDPITSIMRSSAIRPGMNIKLPTMLGDRLLHISGVTVSGRDVTLAVDTKARDAVPVWQIHERNRESRKDPNRTWLREYRSSNTTRDTLGEFSEVGGLNDRRRTLVPGEWIVFEVISGPIEGTIRSLRLSCGSGVEFAVAVFGMKMNAARMNNLVPNPLTEAGRERWKDPDIRQNLEDRVILYAAGVEDDPCGYWPDKKSEGASIITGDWYDDAEFSYRTIPPLTSAFVEDVPLNRFPEPVLYVAVYANAGGYVRPGRVMWPQAEGGV